jgi:hypothetical protein
MIKLPKDLKKQDPYTLWHMANKWTLCETFQFVSYSCAILYKEGVAFNTCVKWRLCSLNKQRQSAIPNLHTLTVRSIALSLIRWWSELYMLTFLLITFRSKLLVCWKHSPPCRHFVLTLSGVQQTFLVRGLWQRMI